MAPHHEDHTDAHQEGRAPSAASPALASIDPFAVFTWPDDALPMTLVAFGLAGSVAMRRRAAVKQRAD